MQTSWGTASPVQHAPWATHHAQQRPAELSDITNHRSRFGANTLNTQRRMGRAGSWRKPQPVTTIGKDRRQHTGAPAPLNISQTPTLRNNASLARAYDPTGVETDPHKISQRMKQIFFGKNTIGYHMYLQQVPKEERAEGNEKHAVTPRADQLCSKRSWDLQVKRWRRTLHLWDPPELAAGETGVLGRTKFPGFEGSDDQYDSDSEQSDTEQTLESRTESSDTVKSLQHSRSNSVSEDLRHCNSHSWASDDSDEPDFNDLSDFQW
eukprot:TRINITY_DN41435_c0_g1_i1.p1 TRINITY_DN41435_c0_g1~~TRINITY_DN41435_c0_g1_i1.p1  ORF type:complete len:265 (+),score=30.80 TRINITY_DN41435_c0_g1_i1:50-844(+)